MIKAGAGLASSASPVAAAQDAVTKACERIRPGRADFGIVFTTGHLARPKALSHVSDIAGTEKLVGCSGYGVLGIDRELEAQPGLAALLCSSDQITATPFSVAVDESEIVGGEIADQLGQAKDGSILILLPDAHADPNELITQLSLHFSRLPIVGAGAANSTAGGETYQFCGVNSATRSVAGILLSGSMKFEIGVTQACQPFTDPLEVTRSEGNKVLELAGEKASEVLKLSISGLSHKTMGVLRGPVFAGLSINPTQPFRSGNYVVRHIVDVDEEEGSVTIAGEVSRGEKIAFVIRDPEGAMDDLYRMLEELRARLKGSPSFGLYFDCMARGSSLYSIPDRDVGAIREVFGRIPLVGFHGNYELAPVDDVNLVHTYTGVLVLVAEQ